MTDLDTLARLAGEATPGPWEARELPSRADACSGHQHAADVFGRRYVTASGSGYPGADLNGRRAEADAAYIAAMHPGVGAALVEIARAAEELRRELQEGSECAVCLAGYGCMPACPADALRAALDRLEEVS